MKNLRAAFIRIAHENPETRKTLLPLVKQADKWEKMPKGWTDESRKQFWDKITGDVKHKVTKCIKEMEGKFDDPGAFCASLSDRVDPGWRSRTARTAAADLEKLSRAADKASVDALQSGFGRATPETRRAHLDAAKKHSAVYKEAVSVRRNLTGADLDQVDKMARHHHNAAAMHRTLASANDNFTAQIRDRQLDNFRSRLASSRAASTVNPQPFGRGDWNTYSGASSFEDGSDPIIAQATLEATIVADAEGIQLMLMGEDSTTDTIYYKNSSFPSQKEATRAAQDALRSIRSGRIPPGFKPL